MQYRTTIQKKKPDSALKDHTATPEHEKRWRRDLVDRVVRLCDYFETTEVKGSSTQHRELRPLGVEELRKEKETPIAVSLRPVKSPVAEKTLPELNVGDL